MLRLKNTFNLSMTYWTDSDINHRSGYIRPSQKYVHESAPGNITTKDSRKILIYCNNGDIDSTSAHGMFVKSLKELIKVETLKWCPNTVHKYSNKGLFFEEIAKSYKFFLLFDSQLCQDYIPESMFYILKNNMIPIFFSNTNFGGALPPKSFINASQYSTAQELADFISMLDKNPNMYSSFFDWKRIHEVEVPSYQGFCDLCDKLTDGVEVTASSKRHRDPVDYILYKFPHCRKMGERAGINSLSSVVDGADAHEF